MKTNSIYIPKGWTATDEALRKLEDIRRDIGAQNNSAAIRYCINEVFRQKFQKEDS